MEGVRDDGGVGAGAAGQERRLRRRGVGYGGRDEEEEIRDGSSSGGGVGVELSLRLRTGADDDDGAPSAAAAAEARRNMTIFYDGRVCAVDVTEVQARAIISMASEETLVADHHLRRQQLMRGDGRQQDGDGDRSSSTSAVARRDRGLLRPAAAAAAVAPSPLLAAAGVVGSPRQQGRYANGAIPVAAPVVDIDQQAADTGLSMKRSLQLFLQKRKARTAAAVAPHYAGGRQAQAVRR